MGLLQNLLIVLVILGLPIVVYFQYFVENVFVLNPLIDTVLPEGFSVEQFDKIKPGMTQQEVLKLVPRPQVADESAWQYGNDGAARFGDFAWFMFQIEFDQSGRVVKTSHQVFHD